MILRLKQLLGVVEFCLLVFTNLSKFLGSNQLNLKLNSVKFNKNNLPISSFKLNTVISYIRDNYIYQSNLMLLRLLPLELVLVQSPPLELSLFQLERVLLSLQVLLLELSLVLPLILQSPLVQLLIQGWW